ncbi:MAG TPA: glutathione synthase [Polyangia bacterium]|nr:glutathione synthase [Polyangia bacterium]
MRVLVVMDGPARIHPETDTTVVIIDEARRRGHAVDTCQPDALELDGDDVLVRAGSDGGAATSLGEFAAVLMRKDPPFDLDYYFATLLLERARGRTLVVNDPRGLREANEKLYIFNFPSLIAPTRVTRSLAGLKRALADFGGQMIVKPLDGCGGSGVFHVRTDDRNTNSILETVTCDGTRLVMAQRYLPEAREGDKRILLLDGEPIGAVLRVPRADETRGNLHVGGTATKTTLTPRDLEICSTLAPRLRADGLYLVGIDVIGGWLTEVNVTSPTGVQEIDRLEGARLEARIVDWLERRVAAR